MVYVSTAPNAHPVFVAHYQLPPGGTAGPQLTWSTSGFNAGDPLQLAIQANATTLSTGRYSYSFQVVDTNANPMTTTYSGSADVLNYKSNALGAGWSLAGVERIFSV